MKELSKRLKELGFPQPEFKFGQKWLYGNETLLVLSCDSLNEKKKI